MGGVGGVSPNLTPSFSNANSSDGKVSSELPVSPMPMYTAGEGMASIGLTPFTSGSEAATLPQVRREDASGEGRADSTVLGRDVWDQVGWGSDYGHVGSSYTPMSFILLPSCCF